MIVMLLVALHCQAQQTYTFATRDTLELKRVFPFRDDTGQLECSGIAIDPDSRTVYMSSWIDDVSSNYLYMYDRLKPEIRHKLIPVFHFGEDFKWLKNMLE